MKISYISPVGSSMFKLGQVAPLLLQFPGYKALWAEGEQRATRIQHVPDKEHQCCLHNATQGTW